MKNFEKRKYISRDISFFENHKPLKKLKINGLEYESRSSINWNEVKIILDATVVEKYLKNKKPVNDISRNAPISNKSRREKNPIPCISQANKNINNVFLQRNNVMVKIEIPNDIRFDHLDPEENLEFVDLPIKEEDISTQDTGTFKYDPINDDEFADSLNDDFQFQNNNCDNHLPLAAELAEVEFKNEISESNIWYKEMTISSEFKHEEIIPQNNEITELIKQKNNNNTIDEMPVLQIRRSSRKRKICHNCDNCDHKVKKSRTPSNVNKKRTSKVSDQNSNCSNKSRTSLKTRQRKTLASPLLENDATQLFHCDHCNYQTSHKKKMVRHLYNKHLSRFSNLLLCKNCKGKFKTKERLKKHECTCTSKFLFNCKFCSTSVTSKLAMKEHLINIHIDEFHGKSAQKVVDEVWCDSVRDAITVLEREGNTDKLTNFGIKFLRSKKYYRERRTDFIKLYCNKCNKIYEKYSGQNTKYCPDCNTQFSYQCQKCEMTTPYHQTIWKHLRNKDTGCNISKSLTFITDTERLMNRSNEVAATTKEENQEIYNCEMCDYEGTTKSQLYKHIVSKHTTTINNSCKERSFMCSKCGNTFCFGKRRFKRHEELCGIYIRYPCKFCPMTCFTTTHLRNHMSSIHVDKLDGINLEDIIEEISTFRSMIREFNLVKFNEKYLKTTVAEEETIDDSNYYLKGIKNIIKPVCFNCNVTVSQLFECCVECRRSLTYQCLRCDEYFEKYTTAWEHITEKCKNRLLTSNITDLVIPKASKSNDLRNLFHCHHCNFKNPSKTVLSRHITHIHKEPTNAIGTRLTCLKCNGSFYNKEHFNFHKLRCRASYFYNCHLCDYTSTTCINMKEHMIKWHSYYYHRDGKGFDETLHDVMQKIVENRRIDNKSIRRFTETGKLVRRTFSENIELVRFHCAKCNETFDKTISRVKNTRHCCSKCQSRLMLQCKLCEKVYTIWPTMANHFGKNLCLGTKPSKVPTYQHDHTYASTEHLDHSYACKFGPLEQ